MGKLKAYYAAEIEANANGNDGVYEYWAEEIGMGRISAEYANDVIVGKLSAEEAFAAYAHDKLMSEMSEYDTLVQDELNYRDDMDNRYEACFPYNGS